jgi:phosphoglycolate phosphatase
MAAGNRFELVIFDYDGTLSDTRLAIAHCIERALTKHGRPAPGRERIMPVVNRGLQLRDTFSLLDPDLRDDVAVMEDIVGTYRTFYRDEGEPLIRIFPGARAALQALHAGGIKCVVVSNKGYDAVARSLGRHGMTAFVEQVFAEQKELPSKPDPALLTDHVLRKFPHIAKERVLMVGDTEIDIEFAKRAGIASCWAAYGFGDGERCLALAPTHLIEAIENLPALMRPQDDVG